MSLTIVVVLVGIVIIGALATMGWIKNREKVLRQRQSQLKLLMQRYRELEPLLQFILKTDNQPDVARALNREMLDLTREMSKLDAHNADVAALQEACVSRESQLSMGTLVPGGETLIESDQQLQRLQQVFNQITHKLQRMKLRNKLPAHEYEEMAAHLKGRLLHIQVESHKALAERMLAEGQRRDAELHLKHARNALKRSAVDFEGKHDMIKGLSDQIKALERGETGATPEPDAT
ncbi:MAG: hypothetical protein D6758_05735 [Gammaproteobacteria bacterium]|nr:MAG: hypothetical protein D6758_05735 [Gammaproteobacteria bacterium]